MSALRALLAAVGFLTVLPVPARVHADVRAFAGAQRWYPAVGWLVGGLQLGLYTLLAGAPPLPRAVAVVLLGVLLTGGMHVDGLADACDGFARHGTPAQRRAAMRDPRLGAFGVMGILFNLLARVALVASGGGAPLGLLAAPAVGRWSMLLALRLAPYDRAGALRAAAPRPGLPVFLTASLLLLAPAAASPRLWGAVAAAALVTGWWIGRAQRELGAVSGDTVGGANELAELSALAVFTLFAPA